MIKHITLAALTLSLTSVCFAYNPVNHTTVSISNNSNCSADLTLNGQVTRINSYAPALSVPSPAFAKAGSGTFTVNVPQDCQKPSEKLTDYATIGIANGSNCSLDLKTAHHTFRISASSSADLSATLLAGSSTLTFNNQDCKKVS